MQEHPIPQDITGYRFHIIGSMTLKQFGEIFVGVVVAVILYSTNLTAIIKWPLILLSVGIGGAAAFLPIEERPLDHWIATFLNVMYKPTKFFWKKDAIIPEAFLFKSVSSVVSQEPDINLQPVKRQRVREYLGSVPEKNNFSTSYTQEELLRMKNILSSFSTVEVSTVQTTIKVKPIKQKPNLDIRVRSMRKPKALDEVTIFNNTEEQFLEPESIFQTNIIPKQKKYKTKKVTLSTDQVAHNIQVPTQEEIKLTTESEKQESQVVGSSGIDLSQKTFIKNQDSIANDIGKTDEAIFNSDLPFPIKPTEPNKLVGMVLSKTRDLLSNSIVEVQTIDGHIERAVKTNALGQFFITTPLKAGDYNVVVEKNGYIFHPLHIKIEDEIIQPIEIRSEN